MKNLVLLINSDAAEQTLWFVNSEMIDLADGKAPSELFVVYGDVPYDRDGISGIQRLTKSDAEFMANYLHTEQSKELKYRAGIPMYVGHPDYTAGDAAAELKLAQHQPPAYAWMKDIVPGEQGVTIPIEWTTSGRDLVESKTYMFFSPAFRSAITGKEGGTLIYSPRILRSAGLTNTPNWPQAPLVNSAKSNDGAAKEQKMTLLERLGQIFGKTLATDDDAVTHVENINAEAKKTKDIMTINTANDATISDLRKQLATTVVNACVARGAVLQEHAESRITDLINSGTSISDRIAELQKLPPLMKTKEQISSEELSKRTKATVDNQQKILDLVHAKMSGTNVGYDEAFSAVKREHKELFTDCV